MADARPAPFAVVGALLGFAGVLAGAFGAHALAGRLTPEMKEIFDTASRYQMIHALALLFTGWIEAREPRPGLTLACILFLAGTVIFSGSLYALALSGTRVWGAVTPVGGLCLLAGWLALAAGMARPAR